MRPLLCLILITTICSCKHSYPDNNHSRITVPCKLQPELLADFQLLALYPNIEELRKNDSSLATLIDSEYTNREEVIYPGLSIDNTLEYAVIKDTIRDTAFFYKRTGDSFREAFKAHIEDIDMYYSVKTEDLDLDGVNEIVFSTSYNMNGNRWMKIFRHDKLRNSLYEAGELFTNYNIADSGRTILVDYNGSWYMDRIRRVYEWQDGKLLVTKELLISLDEDCSDCPYHAHMSYSLQVKKGDTLRKVWSRADNGENKKLDAIWDHFFDGHSAPDNWQ